MSFVVIQIMINGTIPLCSWQYERQFNTTRIPGIETGEYIRKCLLHKIYNVIRKFNNTA